MKALLTIIGLAIAIIGYGQKYTVGIIKTGHNVKNVEGEIAVVDTTLVFTIDGQTTRYKITSRKGFTFHVTDGTNAGRFVVSTSSGRLHGFTYDRHINWHPEKHHAGVHQPVYYCLIKRD